MKRFLWKFTSRKFWLAVAAMLAATQAPQPFEAIAQAAAAGIYAIAEAIVDARQGRDAPPPS